MTANQISTLTQILASTDALFCPFRHSEPVESAAAAIAERRSAFSESGVKLTIRGGGTARLAGERELQDLESRGLVTLHFKKKRIGCSLTEKGDNTIRKITGGYTARESFYLLRMVALTYAEFDCKGNAGLTLETEILGNAYSSIESRELVHFENVALPLLCRKWLTSASDTCGSVGYRVSDAGRRAMEIGKPRTGRLPKYDDIAANEYDQLFLAAIEDRDSWQPSNPALVQIPLGAGSWPRKPEAICNE